VSQTAASVRISVVTPTHNRPASLLRLLRALRDGTHPASAFEAVIVADGCQDDTVAQIQAEALPFPVNVVEQHPARGAAAARNLGASRASGELLVFLDDDIEPLPALLAQHWSEYEAAQVPTVVVGPPLPVRQPNAGLHAISAWAWWHDQFARMQRPGHRYTYDNVFSGNLSVPRSLFEKLGGFDVAFNSCRDDSEFGLRVLRAGARVTFAPAAGGWHHELRDSAALTRRKQAEGAADVRLARLYPELWPALYLSLPERRPSRAYSAVRRLAFGARPFGRTLAAGFERVLPLLEGARMRGTWRTIHAALMYFWYWIGVAQTLGSWRAFAQLRSETVTRAAQRHAPDHVLDLAQGLEAAERALDAARPAGATLRWGSLHVGRIVPRPGAEPLGGRHLRPILADELRRPFASALAAMSTTDGPALPAPRTMVAAAAVSWPVNDGALGGPRLSHGQSGHAVRVDDWTLPVCILDIEVGSGIADVAACAGYRAARALIRRHGLPIGWADLRCPGGVIDAAQILDAVRYQLEEESRLTAAAQSLGPIDIGETPPISVIVCTRDRPELLQRCLQSLARVDYPAFEILVVDNASNGDETREVAEKAGARCIREDIPGLDRARNRGWGAAKYDIIAFTDDDVEVDAAWLRGIAAALDDPTVQFVTGLVAPARMDTEAELLFELAYGGMGKGTAAQRWDPAVLSARQLVAAHEVGVGANMAFRRALLQSLGGFDRALDVGTPAHGGGDLDIFHRALTLPAVGAYEPRALVRHHHRRDMAGLRRQHYDNGRAFGVYLLRILRRGKLPRRTTAWYALRIWLAWLVRRLIKRMFARDPLPGPLIVAELEGALHAPWAYVATYRQARAADAGEVAGKTPAPISVA